MHTAHPTTLPLTLPPLHSRARDWRSLRAFIQDSLADAMHHQAALQGARPELTLMLSRRYLPTHLLPQQEVQHQLQAISNQLRHQGVFHAIHMVVVGNAEPASHELSITLSQI